MSDEAALLNAIIAHAEEDTPRLAYADWLDENGHSDRADFIRSQCAFTAAVYAQPDYPDIENNYYTGHTRAWWWTRAHPIAVPPGFTAREAQNIDSDAYQRGFLHKVEGEWENDPPEDHEVDRVCENLAELVGTTTVRFLDLPDVTAEQLVRILAAPGAEKLTGLSVGPSWGNGDELAEAIANAKSIRGLTELVLNFPVTSTGLRALARARFDRLKHFDLPSLETDCSAAATIALTATSWFRRLNSVWAFELGRTAQRALIAALARLPALDELVIRLEHADGLNAFATPNGFPELGRLDVNGAAVLSAAAPITRGRFPKLRSLEFLRVRNTEFRTLLAAPWFPQLTILDLNPARLTDRAIRALAKSPAAANLQYLRLGDNRLGPTGYELLGNGTVFPNVTLLDLDAEQPLALTEADALGFVERLSLPRVRTLYIDGWPLGNEGAIALANNPSLAEVDGLSVNGCQLTDRGFNALVRSPHTSRVVNFTAENNEIRSLAALLKPGTMPGLRHLWIPNTRVSRQTAERMRPTRNWVVETGNE